MDGSQQFRLKWNNYHVNIASSFDSLRLDEDFVDVTVACDGFQTKAHRMVLSACSPYFRELLKSNPHPHPIVILRDVGRRNLQLLLDYMYHGEVNVAQAQLADFLKVAEMLKVKGLADDRPPDPASAAAAAADTNGRAAPEWPRPESPAAGGGAPPEKRRRASPPASRTLKREPSPQPEPHPEQEPPPPEPESEPEPETKHEPEAVAEPAESLTERLRDGLADSPPTDLSTGQPAGPGPSAGVGYDTGQEPPLAQDPITRLMSCPHCTHLSNNYGKLKAHIGKVHFPVPVTCADCGKVCKNKYAMQVHKSKYHRRAWKVGSPAVPAAASRDRSPPAWSPRPSAGQGLNVLPGLGQGAALVSGPGQGTTLSQRPSLGAGPGQGATLMSGPGQGAHLGSGPGQGAPLVSGPGQGAPLVSGPGQGAPLVSGPGQGAPLVSGPSQVTPLMSGLTQGSPLLSRDDSSPRPGQAQGSSLLSGSGQGQLLPVLDGPLPAAGLDLTRKQGLTPGPGQMQ